MAFQSWPAALSSLVALGFGVTAFLVVEIPARRLLQEANKSRVAFFDSFNDILRGYKELRLRPARRIDVSAIATGSAANDSGAGGMSRTTKVLATASGGAQVSPATAGPSRTSGIGSRFKSAPPVTEIRSRSWLIRQTCP